jgi:hypothetical protein
LDTLKAANVGTGTYNWYKNGVLVGSGRLFKPSTIGIYRCLYVENGCKSDSSALIVLKSLRNSNVKDRYTVIYPNPVSNNEVFISTVSELKSIVLYNVNGQIIQEIKNPSKINEAYKVSNLPKGFYLIQLASENESITKKIMVD